MPWLVTAKLSATGSRSAAPQHQSQARTQILARMCQLVPMCRHRTICQGFMARWCKLPFLPDLPFLTSLTTLCQESFQSIQMHMQFLPTLPSYPESSSGPPLRNPSYFPCSSLTQPFFYLAPPSIILVSHAPAILRETDEHGGQFCI